jgi:hypothetical protein
MKSLFHLLIVLVVASALALPARQRIVKQAIQNFKKSDGSTKTPIILVPGLASSRAYGRWCYKTAENLCSRMSGGTCFPGIPGQDCEQECKQPLSERSWEQIWASLLPTTETASVAECWRTRLEQTFDGKDFLPKHADFEASAWRDSNYDANSKFVLTKDFGEFILT